MASVLFCELQQAADAPAPIKVMLCHQKSTDIDGWRLIPMNGTGLDRFIPMKGFIQFFF